MALSGDDAPDVVQANNSRSEMGQYVGAGLLVPLDEYAEAYGWFDRFPESVRALASYSEDGAVFGEGQLYGLPQMGEIVGLFYNKTKLDELGIEPPATTDEFVAAVEAAQAAGETPVQFGNSEGWPGIHQYGFVQNQFVDAETIRDLGFGRPGSSWTSEDNVAAAEAIVSWADSGYFAEGFSGVDYDTAWQNFAQGDGVFFVGGTWLVADLTDAMGDDVGFVLTPAGASGQNLVTGGISIPWAIPANSENADAAAAYIDFITNSEAMTIVTEAGNLPVVDAGAQQVEGLQAEVFTAWAAGRRGGLARALPRLRDRDVLRHHHRRRAGPARRSALAAGVPRAPRVRVHGRHRKLTAVRWNGALMTETGPPGSRGGRSSRRAAQARLPLHPPGGRRLRRLHRRAALPQRVALAVRVGRPRRQGVGRVGELPRGVHRPRAARRVRPRLGAHRLLRRHPGGARHD